MMAKTKQVFTFLLLFLFFKLNILSLNCHGHEVENKGFNNIPMRSMRLMRSSSAPYNNLLSIEKYIDNKTKRWLNIQQRLGFSPMSNYEREKKEDEKILIVVKLKEGWRNKDLEEELEECVHKQTKGTEGIEQSRHVMLLDKETFVCRVSVSKLHKKKEQQFEGIESIYLWHPSFKTTLQTEKIQTQAKESQHNPLKALNEIKLSVVLPGTEEEHILMEEQIDSILFTAFPNQRASFSVTSARRGVIKAEDIIIHDVVEIVSSFENVFWIEHSIPKKLLNSDIHRVMETETSWNQGVRGKGEIITVMDSGLDWDHCFFSDSSYSEPPMESVDTNRRKVVGYYRTNSTTVRYSDKVNGHGTHVAGIAAGGILPSHANYSKLEYYNGVAPDAKIIMWAMETQDDGIALPDDLFNTFEHAFEEGSFIHTNSWGSNIEQYIQCVYNCYCTWGPKAEEIGGGYENYGHFADDEFCKQHFGAPCCYANAVYNEESNAIDDALYTHEDMVILFAASNDGGKSDQTSISNQAASKNAIVVGSSNAENTHFNSIPRYTDLRYIAQQMGYENEKTCCEESRAFRPLCCRNTWSYISTPEPRYSSFTVTDFSSRGPSLDGRIRPDVVANGHIVISAHSDGIPDSNQCADEPPLMHNKAALIRKSGTSMSTPAVAGAAALIREYYRDGHYSKFSSNANDDGFHPSGMLVKATLANSGKPLERVYIGDGDNDDQTKMKISNKPNSIAGFGQVNLNRVINYEGGDYFEPPPQLFVFDSGSLEEGEEDLWTLRISSSGTLRVTITWYDPPATPGSDNIVLNRLDLHVGDQSDTRLDVTKHIEIDSLDGEVTHLNASVVGASITSGPQRYAIVMTLPSETQILGPGSSRSSFSSSSSESDTSDSNDDNISLGSKNVIINSCELVFLNVIVFVIPFIG